MIRVFSFFPFFLLGYLTPNNIIEKIQDWPKPIFYFILCLVLMFSVFLGHFKVPYTISFFAKNLNLVKADLIWLGGEVVSIIVGTIISICIINIIPKHKSLLTKIGASSMTIYLFHGFPYLREFFSYIISFDKNILHSYVYWFTISIISIIIFSSETFAIIFSTIVHALKRAVS